MARKRNASRLTFGLSGGAKGLEAELHEQLAKSMVVARVGGADVPATEQPSLKKSILNILNGPGSTIERLAFEEDPTQKITYAGVYKPKLRLIPDDILKRIAIQDSLVATIVRLRQNQAAPFGRPRPDRFSTGFIIQPETGVIDKMDVEEKKKFADQVKAAAALLATCGHTKGVEEEHQSTFAEYLSLSVRNAIVVGRIATEVVYSHTQAGDKKFAYFVAADAGTIYRATNDKSAQDSVRTEAYHLLKELAGKKLVKEQRQLEDYIWVQVINGRPVQVFTSDEMKVYNFYAVPDVELGGYPVTPLDTVITAVTTHINIVTHNKLYFQSGRATRGMLVISSDDANPTVIHNIKQQFNASINNVNNAWRMPVFGCGTEESIEWKPIDSGTGRDAEFQYLTDMNAREIISAFMMSPDELPGWAYLSRGTNNQALSESNNEYKLEAARDVGIRPLLTGFEDFINSHLFPLIDPELAKKAKVRLVGLDADNAEKEAVRTQQDQDIWMSYDDIMERVEKQPIGMEMGGSIPLNQRFQATLDKYCTFGEIQEFFRGKKGASQDPSLAFYQNPFWFQMQQMIQMEKQAQMQAAAGGAPGGGAPSDGGGGGSDGGPPSGGGGDSGGGKGAKAFPGQQTENQKTEASQDASGGAELGKAIDQAFVLMSKSENLPPNKRRLLAQHQKTIDFFVKGFEEDAQHTVREILEVAEHHAPRPRKR